MGVRAEHDATFATSATCDLLVGYTPQRSDVARKLSCRDALVTQPGRSLAHQWFMVRAARAAAGTALAARIAIGLFPFASLACHGAKAPTNKGPVPESVRCDSREGGFAGPSVLKSAADRDAWVTQHGAATREHLHPESCAEKFVAFVESTDLSTHTLRFDSGYSAGLLFPASDDGHTVTLAAGRVCGGAYPTSATQVVRIPTGRALRLEIRGGDCPRDVP